jgi:hypothetical protein
MEWNKSICEIANPHWKATSLGIYRFWRFGVIGIGFIADIFDLSVAVQAVAGIFGKSDEILLG